VGFAAPASKPNVIVFLIDDMGYGDIGPYGVKDAKTPHMDRLAREGVRFVNSYSNAPVCTPTRCGLMTGRYQQRYGLEWALLPTQREFGLASTEPTLPRLMKKAGYRTAMFGKWHLGVKPEYGPNAHGFDEFFGILGGNVDHYAHRNINGTPDLYENTELVNRPGYMTDLLNDRSVKYLDGYGQSGAKDPFFLYVAYNAVHWPFQPPDRPDARTRENWMAGTRADYVRMVERIDDGVGAVLGVLDKHKLADNTLVILTNDNGGERFSRNEPAFHHKATVWEGGIRVPTLMRWPGHVPAGKVSQQTMITMDLTATIVAAAGAAPAADRPLEGIDLVPIVSGQKPETERTLFWRIDRDDRKQKAVRRGRYKYVRDGSIEMLFDLDTDVSERHDIAPEQPKVLAELRQSVAAWEKDLARNPPPFVVK
jgi:arylsulfatase A-like enzyme